MKTARLSGTDFREVGSAVNTLLPAPEAGIVQPLNAIRKRSTPEIREMLPKDGGATLEHRLPLAQSPIAPRIATGSHESGDLLSLTATLDGYTRHGFKAMCAHYGCTPADWLAGHLRDEVIAWLELSGADPLLPALIAAENPLVDEERQANLPARRESTAEEFGAL